MARSPSRVMSVPPTTMRPEVGESRPARMPSRVDLPEPEGPVSAIHSPGSTLKETPLRMGTQLAAERKRARQIDGLDRVGVRHGCTTHSANMYYMTMP